MHPVVSISTAPSTASIKIGCPISSATDGQARLAAIVGSANERHELYYSVPEEFGHWFAADRCDGFVVGLLLQAMERNENIVTESPMSSRLWHSLSQFYIPMMAQAFPNLHRIEIIPVSLTSDVKPVHGVATGFSGGIDSFAAVIQHFVRETSPTHRVTHFLFHNVGSHGNMNVEADRRLFHQRHALVQPFAQEIGIPAVPVDSNLAYVFPIDFVRMHSILNASVPLVLQGQFQRFYYASAYKYADCGVCLNDDMAYFDPMALHLLSTEGLDCVSTGCEMSRVEKTELVATYEPSQRYLNVCVDSAFEGRNCSVCFKCRRTMLTLELLGLDHLYRKVFDFEKFARIRRRYLKEIILHYPHSFEKEIAEAFYAPRSRWWGYLVRTGGWIRKHRQYKKK